MKGLYALKPWYADRLHGIRLLCVRQGVTPATLTWAGVAAGAAAGAALAATPQGPVAAVLVAVLLAIRLGFANLDGGVARESGRLHPWGVVENELGDRLADVAALVGLFALADPLWALAVLAAATVPSWISLAGRAAGGPRLNGGLMGKTERCAVLVVIALLGASPWLLALLVGGSLLTATMRLRQLRIELGGAR